MTAIETKLSKLFRSGRSDQPKVEAKIDALFARHLVLFRQQRASVEA